MDNVVELRKNQPFKVGEKVRIGTNLESFLILDLGTCAPEEVGYHGGKLINGSEFVQLAIPGTTDGSRFDIHVSHLTRVYE